MNCSPLWRGVGWGRLGHGSTAPSALNQHWHPRFHHDPAIIWLRYLMKSTFENYPQIVLEKAPPQGAAATRRPGKSRKT